MDFVVFSIDNWYDLHTRAKFLRMMDTHRAMGSFTGDVKIAIGCYNDVMEDAYIMNVVDFDNHVRHSGYVDNQESFLFVGQQPQMPFWLKDREGNTIDSGQLVSNGFVPEHLEFEDWTYRPDLKLYFYRKVY